MTKTGLIYLASPYAHNDDSVRHKWFIEACRAAAWLIAEGYKVFSPIAHGRPIAGAFEMIGLPCLSGFEAWRDLDLLILSKCEGLVVLVIDGWDRSVGVQAEIQEAHRLGMPVEWLTWEAGPEHREKLPGGSIQAVGGPWDPTARQYKLVSFATEAVATRKGLQYPDAT